MLVKKTSIFLFFLIIIFLQLNSIEEDTLTSSVLDSKIGLIDSLFFKPADSEEFKLNPFKNNDLWGFKNQNDEIMVSPIYDSLYYFQEKLSLAKKNGKWGYIDKNNTTVIDFIFDDATSFSSGLAAVKFDNDFWGYINNKGKVIIEPIYSIAFPFCDEVARVYSNSWKLIDKKGNILWNFEKNVYFSRSKIIDNKVVLYIRTGTNWYNLVNIFPLGYNLVINPKMENSIQKYDYSQDFEDKILVRNNTLSGVLDKNWNTIIPLEYEGLIGSNDKFLAAKKNDKWGIIDLSNTIVLDFIYSDAMIIKNIISLKSQNNWFVFICNKRNNRLFKVDEVSPFKSEQINYLMYEIKGDSKLKTSNNSKKIFETVEMFIEGSDYEKNYNPHQYSKICDIAVSNSNEKKMNKIPAFIDNCIRYKLNDKLGLINIKSEVLTDPIYDEIIPLPYGVAKVKSSNKTGLINSKGEIILQPTFDEIEPIEFGFLKASIAEKIGLIDYTNKIILQTEYDSISEFSWFGSMRYAKIRKDSLFGLIDNKGNIFLDPVYNSIENFEWFGGDFHIKISQNGLFGVINAQGKLILPIKYENIKPKKYGKIMVKENGIEKPIGIKELMFIK